MRPVRVFVLVLAIVLLPLRGWLGGAMAMASAPLPAQAAAAAATAEHCHPAAGDNDAASPSATPHGAGHEGTGDASHPHAQCSLCQLCHSVAMTGDTPAPPAAVPAQARPPAAAQRFASALPQLADKPPIS